MDEGRRKVRIEKGERKDLEGLGEKCSFLEGMD